MEPDQQEALDQQVEQVMQALTEAGERVTAESVRSRVGKRMHDVLAAIHRVTGTSPTAPDVDMDPADDPAVLEAARKVESITAALQDAERTLQARETLLLRAETAAAEAMLDGREPISLIEGRQAVLDAADMARLLALAQSTAKERYAAALVQAQAQHWAMVWQSYQDKIRAFDVALSAAVEAQEEARLAWVSAGQPGEVPLLKTGLANFEPYFHGFLQGILDMPPEQVRRGALAMFAREAG